MLLNPTETAIAAANLRDVETAARAMGLDIRVLNASNRDEVDAAYATLAGERPATARTSHTPIAKPAPMPAASLRCQARRLAGDAIEQIRVGRQSSRRQVNRNHCAPDPDRPCRRGDRMSARVQRREFITLLGGAAAAWPRGAHAQQGGVWRLGALETTSLASNSVNFNTLREALRNLGYVEGQNLVIVYRSADGRDERFPQLAAELVNMKVDLILARGTPATVAARNASGTIPIVMTSTADPFAIVGNIARPGGNVTGLASLLVDLISKRLSLLAEIVPSLSRVGLLSNPDNPTFVRTRKDNETSAQSLRI